MPAWWRLLRRGRFRVSPQCWGPCLFDGLFAAGNSSLRLLQHPYSYSRVRQVELPDDPVFVIGHWRTGTTWMHELLAVDPRLRAPTSFECFVPNHFLISRRLMAPWSGFVLPRQRPPDKMAMGWERPQEDEFALCLRGAGSLYDQIAFPQDLTPSCPTLNLERLNSNQLAVWKNCWFVFLKELLVARPGRLLLKSPTHTFRLEQIAQWFPKARFVMMVRDPYDVFASTRKLWQSLFRLHRWQRWSSSSDPAGRRSARVTVEQQRLREFILRLFASMHERSWPIIEKLGADRCQIVRFEDFTSTPKRTLERLYESLGLERTTEIANRWEEAIGQRSGYQPDRYELDDVTRREINQAWQPYFDDFEYASR